MRKERNIFRDFIVYFTSVVLVMAKQKDITVLKDLTYFSKWRQFRNSDYGTLEHEIPWIVFSSIDYLKKHLSDQTLVFEFGSGGSTEYLRKRVKSVISVEHDAVWYNRVQGHFEREVVDNVKLMLIEPEQTNLINMSGESQIEDCFSARKEFEGYSFKKYVTLISKYPDNYFDVIIVDGRSRVSCIFYSLKKVKKGGLLLIDNADRTEYLAPFPELKNCREWKLNKFTGHFPFASASVLNQTFIFEKL